MVFTLLLASTAALGALAALAVLAYYKPWRNPYAHLTDKELFSRLRLACIDCEVDVARKILKLGRVVDLDRHTMQSTLLCITSRGGDSNIFKLLLEYGASKNARTPKGDTPLICAARNGHIDRVEMLLDLGVDVNGRGHRGWTALHWASLNGRYEIAATLVAYGADIDSRTDDGSSCIFLGCLSGHSTLVDDLINFGSNVFTVDIRGDTPLHAAARQNGSSLRPLLKVNAAYQKNLAGETPIDAALTRGHRKFIDKLLLAKPELYPTFHSDAIALACRPHLDPRSVSNIFKVLSELSALDFAHFESTVKSMAATILDLTRSCLAQAKSDAYPISPSTTTTASLDVDYSSSHDFIDEQQPPPDADIPTSPRLSYHSSTPNIDINTHQNEKTTPLPEDGVTPNTQGTITSSQPPAALVSLLSIALTNIIYDVMSTPKAKALSKSATFATRTQSWLEPLWKVWPMLSDHITESMALLETHSLHLDAHSSVHKCLSDTPMLMDRFFGILKSLPSSHSPSTNNTQSSMERYPQILSFVEQHRKALRFMIERDAELLTSHLHFVLDLPCTRGSFDDLIEKLTFEQKQNWLRVKIESEQTHAKTGSKLEYDRFGDDAALLSLARQINSETPENLRGKLLVKFIGEVGVGAGVQREWFQAIVKRFVDPETRLFEHSHDDKQSYHALADANSTYTEETRSELLRCFGRLCAMALVHEEHLSFHLSLPICKSILSRPHRFEDLKAHNEMVHRSLTWMKENTDIDNLGLNFEVVPRGTSSPCELVPNGKSMEVDDFNKEEYIRLLLDWYFVGEVEQSLKAIREGFHDIIPHRYVAPFHEPELALLICGQSTLDLLDWKAHTDYSGELTSESEIVTWFWHWMEKSHDGDRRKLLQFVTGSTTVPLGGFRELRGVDTKVKFNISKAPKDSGSLPTASTCFNMLKFPDFATQADFESKLELAINEGSMGFSFH